MECECNVRPRYIQSTKSSKFQNTIVGGSNKGKKKVSQWLKQFCSKLEEGSYCCFTLPPTMASWWVHKKQYTMLRTTLKKYHDIIWFWYFPVISLPVHTLLVLVNACICNVILDRNQGSMWKWQLEAETERKNERYFPQFYVLFDNTFQDRNTTSLADSPLGRPSCCSSLDRDSLSTLCFAALEKMKLSIATLALMSPISAT